MAGQLSEPFTPDDAFVFGPRSLLDLDHNPMVSHSKESLSFDEVCPCEYSGFLSGFVNYLAVTKMGDWLFLDFRCYVREQTASCTWYDNEIKTLYFTGYANKLID